MNNFKTADVQFETGDQPRYTYKTNFDCKAGDLAIVKTREGRFKIVYVAEVHDTPKLKPGIKYTWLVQIIDTRQYDEAVKNDQLNEVKT